ncbi:MAG: putative glycoside hydrolase [Oscillospiraceae bacterium]|nr:putative glycoside hydrolase [Oscillospiraceae bacterium]
MRKNKRIFRPKRRYKIKRRNNNGIKIAASVAAVAVLVFVGYSVAGPIGDYIKARETQIVSEPWSPEQQTDTSAPDISDDMGTVNESEPVQTESLPDILNAPITATAQTEGKAPPEAPAETIVTEGTARPVQPAVTEADVNTAPVSTDVKNGGAAYTISLEDMQDFDSLEAALDEIRSSGASAVIMPMKADGGAFYYKTEIPFVATVTDGEKPIKSEVTAKQAANAALAKGLRPVALVSVLKDNNRYGDYRDGSYRSNDDTTWLDAAPDNGGKPWIDPFDEVAQDYLCDIMRELGGAGFGEIICEDFVFPDFRSTDVELIGEHITPFSSARYKALASLACMMTEAGSEKGARVMIRITANSIIKDYSEIFHPDLLQGCTILIDYSEDNIAKTMVAGGEEIILDYLDEDDKIMAVFAEVERQCGDIPTEAFLDRESMSAEEFAAAVSTVSGMGYEGYYVY